MAAPPPTKRQTQAPPPVPAAPKPQIQIDRKLGFVLLPIYPYVPPKFAGRSYLGGLPNLSPSQTWPRTGSGKPMTFVGQIDFSELPPVYGQVSPFPRQGALSFFIDLIAETPKGNCVLHHADVGTLQEAQAPADLEGIVVASDAASMWGNKRFADMRRKSYPRTSLAIEGVACDLRPEDLASLASVREQLAGEKLANARDLGPETADLIEDEGNAETELRAWRAAFERKIARLTPKPGPGFFSRLGLPWLNEPDFAADKTNFDLDDAYPWTWLFIEYFAMRLLDFLDSSYRQRDHSAWFGGDFEAQAASWLQKARDQDSIGVPTGQERAKFRTWQRTLVDAIGPEVGVEAGGWDKARRRNASAVRSMIFNSLIEATRELLPLGPNAGLPANFLTEIEDTLTSTGTVTHQMLGPASFGQAAPVTMRDHVLLAQFASDRRLGWMWGDLGVLQFWVRPDDLKERNFANVLFTMEGG